MDNGILNSATVKATIGRRLMDARGDMTRKELCEKLNKCNIYHPDKEISEDVLKMWELGRNTINIEWIPAVCHVLHCDVGYLFGDYPCKKRIISDVQTEIGLSEEAIVGMNRLKALDSLYSKTMLRLISKMVTDKALLPEIYRSYVEIWNIEQGISTVDDLEKDILTTKNGGVYLFGADAVDTILFSVQKKIVEFMEKFFISDE